MFAHLVIMEQLQLLVKLVRLASTNLSATLPLALIVLLEHMAVQLD